MEISIVIPAHDGAQFLDLTIQSVLAQTVTDWELIVVDDGSTDDTAGIARAYAQRDERVRLVQQPNAGVGAARNRGLWESRPASEYVIFLDHDDIWERNALAELREALCTCPDAVAANGLSRIVDKDGEPREPGELEMWGRRRWGVRGGRVAAWPAGAPTTFAVLACGNCIYTPGQVLIRRSALEAVGPFDAALSPADDWDMWLRLSQIGEIAYLDKVLLNWRAHGGNGSMQKERINQLHREVRRKLLRSPLLRAGQRRTVLLANRAFARRVCSTRMNWAREKVAGGDLWGVAQQFCQAVVACVQGARGAAVAAPFLAPTVKELYRNARATPSDINEHLKTLCRLARGCDHVTEFGTRWGVSTTAFLRARPAVLASYDRERMPSVDVLERAARELGRTRFTFHQTDVLDAEIEETDLLFIDTWHTYDQLKQELARHAGRVRRYLVFHDTSTYAEAGEAPGCRGLWPAIEEFLRDNPHWTLAARLCNNNGLTILARQKSPLLAGGSSKAMRCTARQ